MKTSRSEFHMIRGVRYHVRRWGDADAPLLFLVHGYMDMSLTWQFVVDAFEKSWNVVAADWRGFGQSGWEGNTYWFSDYLADLDALGDLYSPEQPMRLVAHSMGGNIASLYAGVRPNRVAGLVNMEGYAVMPSTYGKSAAYRMRRWINEQKQRSPEPTFADAADFAERLMRSNPRLDRERALFLATEFTRPLPDGRVGVACDPVQRIRRPASLPREDFIEMWRECSAPVLAVSARDSEIRQHFGGDDELMRHLAAFPQLRHETLEESGHNMHHDQPRELARLIESFFSEINAKT